MKILVTGAAGFIGFHLSRTLLETGENVIGIDNLNAYYDVKLKKARLNILKKYNNFRFLKRDIAHRSLMASLFHEERFDQVVHLAAQAGVRYSLVNPFAYMDSNVLGFLNILEGCRQVKVQHLVFASSSSVYGVNVETPFSVRQNVDHPISLYAATKKSNELMAHVYAVLFGMPCTGLRFFTVYGPWGRPDMALFLFTKAILEGRPIDVFNHGKMKRDFTYIDDIVEGVIRVVGKPPTPITRRQNCDLEPGTSFAAYRIFNIGNNRPVSLLAFIRLLEKTLGKKSIKHFVPMQPGDVPQTFADIRELTAYTGFKPKTPIEIGIPKFVEWYKDYYGIS